MEELKQPYYSAFCEIGQHRRSIKQAFQDHKQHYLDALQWCTDRDISIVESVINPIVTYTFYVRYHVIRFTDREDCLAFTLAYGDLYIRKPKEE